MFAHVSLGVSDINKSVLFYDAVMKPLGYDRLFGDINEEFMAYGPEDSFFIINTPLDAQRGKVVYNNGMHICLKATDKQAVDAFYEQAMAAGAKCAGKPDLRPHYAADYYAAFIFDPDGHKIEAVARIKE